MNEELHSEVVQRWHGGQSMRGIARDLGISRHAVAKAIAEHQQQRAGGATGLPAPRKRRRSRVDPFEDKLREYLARYPEMTAVRLLEELRRLGYTGGYTANSQIPWSRSKAGFLNRVT